MIKETWEKIWAEVEVSNLGNVRLDIKKIQALASKPPIQSKMYDEPKMVKVKSKIGNAGSESRKRQVICLDTNQVFESVTAACKYYKLSDTTLCNCLKGKTRSLNGLHWAYYTEQN